MENTELLYTWIAGLIAFAANLISFIYGLVHFFKKGKPLCMQSLTLAMGSHALGSVYHVCQALTGELTVEGFTPAYLGRIGFFLFIIAGSYGQLDRIVDDRSPAMRRARILALAAPLCAILLYLPNLRAGSALSTEITYALVWIPALFAVYFNLKHALIPDLDFGFIKAIRPYNIMTLCLGLSELLCLTAWEYMEVHFLFVSTVLFGALSIATMIAAKKGVDKWTI
ncbi:MAG: hypothetical protein IKT68_00930 [Clostridia bacterium]|nr:hypothetical protein [Clostridia bacterium]